MPELGEVCRRMGVLCGRLESGGGHQVAMSVLLRLIGMHTVRCELDTAIELGQQLATLNGGSVSSVQLSHMSLGTVHAHRGDVKIARRHLDAALAGLPASRDDLAGIVPESPDVWTMVFSAWNRWAVGDGEDAEREVLAAVALGADLGEGTYPHVFALWFSWLLAVLRTEPEKALERSDHGIELARRGGFAMLVPPLVAFRGWALGRTGDVDLAIAEIEAAAELGAGTGTRMLAHVFPAFLADTHLWAGRAGEAVLHARVGIEKADETGERFYEPELHRLLGIALAETDRPEALASLQRAVELADAQGNRALGDRARRSLAQLG